MRQIQLFLFYIRKDLSIQELSKKHPRKKKEKIKRNCQRSRRKLFRVKNEGHQTSNIKNNKKTPETNTIKNILNASREMHANKTGHLH